MCTTFKRVSHVVSANSIVTYIFIETIMGVDFYFWKHGFPLSMFFSPAKSCVTFSEYMNKLSSVCISKKVTMPLMLLIRMMHLVTYSLLQLMLFTTLKINQMKLALICS